MTTRPRLHRSSAQAVGVLAVVLFGFMAAVFLSADLDQPAGLAGDGSITASIGYAMFNLAGGAYESEGFLVAFEIIDVVLVAALAAAVMLGLSDAEEGPLTDGGEPNTTRRSSSDPASDGPSEGGEN